MFSIRIMKEIYTKKLERIKARSKKGMNSAVELVKPIIEDIKQNKDKALFNHKAWLRHLGYLSSYRA